MTELSTAQSYIVRVYRVDPDNPCNIAGLVEAMDGSGERSPFTDIDELAAVLNCLVKGHRRERRIKKRIQTLKTDREP